jgi:hypothetical protein
MKIKLILLVVGIATLASCNKTKQASKRLSGETWKVVELSVDGITQAELPTTLVFNDCDIYAESCNGEWNRDAHHAHFIWQFREKGKKFELSNQSSAEDAHGGGHEAEENIAQCAEFSGVYEVINQDKKMLFLESMNTIGYAGQKVVFKLEKQ